MTTDSQDHPQPLRGVRVIELAHWMAGPAATGVLSDWGAEVIKVEPHGGEAMRHIWGSMGARADAPNGAFISANRAKKSIELNVRSEAGLEAFHKLLEGADILVSNMRPSALQKLGLYPADVAEQHPRLIFCSLTAYGWGGPDQERAGYDLASFFGRTGIAHEITTQGTAPAPLMQGLGDTFTAMTSVAGILAALYEREKTGRGRFVESSLLRTGMWALAGELGAKALGGRPRPPYPRENCPTPLYNSYKTSDDRWFFLVGVEAKRHLPRVLAAIGQSALLEDERFSSARAISKNRKEFIPVLDAAFGSRTLEQWRQIFDEHDVWWAPVQTPEEVLADEQARLTGAWVSVDGIAVDGVEAISVDAPVRFDQTPRLRVAAPPAAGEHTHEILEQLGYSGEQITALSNGF
ncbi:CaiB/BaiF CoA transferase family protein [Arthrobacter globiformis]|uniref:CaiB/BaiF CoA transferase family protein n=1 Tax=Arthrobacter globiformis TaxID=1665 RepID=UPI00279127C4|nr:CaiB/BaiF CoA-transferase family protein [Arthrobacter globiformis]MDQ0616693.1 crotonobetainyl-CoA:carnitine CoA-transferase CaiB-like acyl-CoA transferase [Arthrobacter globiformis]